MADLNDIQAAQSIKIIGSDAAGLENTPITATAAGGLHVNLRDSSGVEEGTRTNPVQMSVPNFLSIVNSTSTPLAANAVFTGTAEDVLDYASVTIQVYSDQTSLVLGFRPQYSVNGTNWDDADAYTIVAAAAGNGKFFTFPPQARYFRAIYTNGVVAQAEFRLQTVFHRNAVTPSSHRIGDILDDENDAQLSKSITAARRADNTYDNVKSTNNNELRTADILDGGGLEGAIVIGTSATAARVGAANLVNRKSLTVYNNGTVAVYWGFTAAVTVSSGTPLIRSQFAVFDVGPNTTIYLISTIASQNVRVTEGV